MDYKTYHIPVLIHQLMDRFELSKDAIICDGTMGFAGHASEILNQYPNCHYYGFDKDIEAIEIARKRCADFPNVTIINQPFSTMVDFIENNHIQPTHLLLDLGVSSFQIDQSKRGFTFQKDEPLDMRMDMSASLTAKTVLSEYSKEALITIFQEEGDIKFPNQLVDEISKARVKSQLNTTFDLVECVKRGSFVKSRRQFISMCTKVFQAIRIEVNGEMEELRHALSKLLTLSNVMVAVITFQPNEDRLVKAFVKEHQLQRISKKPIQASYQEAKKNPREKSAKLRIFKV